MPGGLIQLNAYGSQNQYLNGNPQMTFFKSVFRRYTNFSMETIRLELNGSNELSVQNPSFLNCKIDRQGDLVTQIYLVFNLPDIYSGYDNTVPSSQIENSGYQFQWIKSIGTNIINTVSLIVGGNTISKLYGEWIRIWHELFSKDNMEIFDTMTGNLPELFAPQYSTGASSTYPTSTLNPLYSNDPELFSASSFLQNPYKKAPSIRARTIYVPLPFWFATNSGLALPLLCLQYHEVYVQIELKRLVDLYTIKETNINDPNFGKRVAPNILKDYQAINNFITLIPSNEFVYGMNLSQTQPVNGWGLDPHLDVQYIFLDDDERKRFAAVSHEYLIEQVFREDFFGEVGPDSLNLYLNNPVKALIWFAVRDDFETQNIYSNYTNWVYDDIPVSSVAYMRNIYGEVEYVQNAATGLYTINDLLTTADNNNEIADKFNFTYFDRDIITEATLMFNGVNRFDTRDYIYFNYVQGYQHPISNSLAGVQMYSFALDPTLDQPSGACNMSRIKSVQLQINTINVLKNSDGTYPHMFNIYVYSINYNIFRVLAGMGSIGYAT